MRGFWDASAIVPLCVPAENSGQSRRLLRQHAPVVWWSTSIEVTSALARLKRERVLSEEQHRSASQRLAVLSKSWREIQPTNRLRNIAENRLDRYDLRAADALQLAAALVWCSERPKNRDFLCRDIRLREAARQEGFSIVEF
jgi:predicted nucleic acid-binding protein